ncbi:prepilin-type N-terminal cleavage/methylation domain-containing protein [Clostridium sp. Ade.TY]|uniref:PulJ/GspJ family protein n=1 Tax=Clostridium sp. Ade.TY TaxID=1391647 RepID=UPI00040D92A6|nr:prepilin-type N-terminal cleavage/methylation domain-containing protein [Clostridium sp. Ade.TY]
MKKRGFTLIECLAYVFISSIIVICLITLTLDVSSYSSERNNSIKREDEIDRAILNIKKIFSEVDNTNYKIGRDEIEISKEEETLEEINNSDNIYDKKLVVKYKKIYLVSKTLQVRYYKEVSGSKVSVATNLILNDVNKLNFHKKGKLIYMELGIDDKEYLICM